MEELSSFSRGFGSSICGMSVLRWMIPPVFLFYLGCELIHIYTREILSAECPIRRYRYAVYSVQFRSELRHSLEASVLVSRFDRSLNKVFKSGEAHVVGLGTPKTEPKVAIFCRSLLSRQS